MIIDQKISIEARYLDSNLLSHIFNRIRELYEKKCLKKYGYILEIQELISVKNNVISAATSCAIFDVSFQARTLKPEKGDQFTGIVFLCLEIGLLVDILDTKTKNEIMRILIPEKRLKGYIFDNVASIYHQKLNDKILTIEPGMNINVIIEQIKYEKCKFHCIGSI